MLIPPTFPCIVWMAASIWFLHIVVESHHRWNLDNHGIEVTHDHGEMALEHHLSDEAANRVGMHGHDNEEPVHDLSPTACHLYFFFGHGLC